jgi:very-short-patch-repair endonuclease
MNPRDFARQLRKKSTDAERLVWYHLRSRRFSQFKFRRQVPIGKYVGDFVCQDAKLVVELDGGQHASAKDYDTTRDHWLQGVGYRVLRFPDNVVLKELNVVLEVIWQTLQPPPENGRRGM